MEADFACNDGCRNSDDEGCVCSRRVMMMKVVLMMCLCLDKRE